MITKINVGRKVTANTKPEIDYRTPSEILHDKIEEAASLMVVEGYVTIEELKWWICEACYQLNIQKAISDDQIEEAQNTINSVLVSTGINLYEYLQNDEGYTLSGDID